MDLTVAKSELQVRLYRYALEVWDHELKNDCPLLQMVTSAVNTLENLRALPEGERPQLARALTKRFHKEACIRLGEPITVEEAQMLKRLDVARGDRLISPSYQPPASADRAVRRAVIVRLKSELEFLGKPQSLGRFSEWQYVTPWRAWKIVTDLEALGRFGDCSYSHRVETVDGRRMTSFLSLLSWMGVSSTSKWRVSDEQSGINAALAIATLCRHFFDTVAPQILEGLTVES